MRILKKPPGAIASKILLVLLISTEAFANEMTIYIPIISESTQQHLFFHELLETALIDDGQNPRLITPELPQRRSKYFLNNGEISIFWMIESEQRNKQFIPIEVGLTNGLISKRILFIKKGDQHLYNNVDSLEDFRKLNLTGGMGEKWFDTKVWKANHLKYKEQSGEWKSIFRMIPAGRDYHYFSRGLNEIIVESKEYPDLAIEENLVLIYDRDYRFYLSKSGKNAGGKYKKVIEKALKKAEINGLIDKLVMKYWGSHFQTLNYDRRIKINLKTPK